MASTSRSASAACIPGIFAASSFPANAREPKRLPYRPSSSLHATTASGCLSGTSASRIVLRHSRAARTPSAPSRVPPSGTESMWEPVRTTGAPSPSLPKVLPAGSTDGSSPASFLCISGPDVPRVEAYKFLREWQKRLFDAGFIGLTWPKEYGGRGLTFLEEFILHEEMALAKAPPVLNILGIAMAGPTIIAYGTEEQKKRYLSKILSCEEIWCQGYSEPNAGSDLASLQCRAVRDGDHFVVNGQKVWTSIAQAADWMMLLARTDPDASKHKGITYFLLDMHSPGVSVRPLRQITGDAEFNEVFFENVRVPVENVLGGVNKGWEVGITTLMYERLALGFGLQVRLRIALDALVGLAQRTKTNGGVATKDPIVRQKLAQLWIDTEAFKYTGARAITKLLKGEMPGAEASTGKIWWCETG